MPMSKKDFVLVSNVFYQHRVRFDDYSIAGIALDTFIVKLAHELESTNPGFDYFLFLKACGLDKNKVKEVENEQ